MPSRKQPRVHLIWSHPRLDSLTAEVVSQVRDALTEVPAEIDELDLYRSGFDPTLHQADEPDWANPDKIYSVEVEQLIERVLSADLVIVVFPVWWFGLPAMLKGYFDRVWNNGRLYYTSEPLPISGMLWIGLAGVSQTYYEAHGYDRAIATQLNEGIAGYCGIEERHTVFLYNTIDGANLPEYSRIVSEALEQMQEAVLRS